MFLPELKYIDIKCRSGKDECPFYKSINGMIANFTQPVCYAPIIYSKIEKRKTNMAIKSFQEFEDAYYGQHICDIKEVRQQMICKKIYLQILESIDISSTSEIFYLCHLNWFRQIFNLFFRKMGESNQFKKEIIEITASVEVDVADYANYFGKRDIFNLFRNEYLDEKQYDGQEILFDYKNVKGEMVKIKSSEDDRQQQYYDYLKKTYKEEEIFLMYKSFLMRNPVGVPLWENEYKDPTSFVFYFERQLSQYIDVIRAIETKGRLNIIGDGPGTASLAAWTLGRDYVSMEPNPIGDIARNIGLIKVGVGDKDNDILLLFNVKEYLTKKEMEEYLTYDSVVLVDENVDKQIKGMDFHIRGGGKVFYKKVKMKDLSTFPVENTRYLFNRNGKLVDPQDYKATVLAQIMGIKVGEGKKVIVGDGEEMNLVTRNDPNDKRAKPKGSMKNVRGTRVKVYPGRNEVILNDSKARVYYQDYGSMRYVKDYHLIDDYYYVKTLAPQRVQFIVERETAIMLNVYLIRRIMHGGVLYGVFRDYRTMMSRDLAQMPSVDCRDEMYEKMVDVIDHMDYDQLERVD